MTTKLKIVLIRHCAKKRNLDIIGSGGNIIVQFDDAELSQLSAFPI